MILQKSEQNTIQKPTPLPVLIQNIPQELKELEQWVCWKYKYQPNRAKPWTKPPYDPRTGQFAKSNKPATWVTFEEAYKAYKDGKYDGIGLALHPDDGLTGLDLDHCLDPQKSLSLWAQEVVDHFAGTYWECSPSDEGLRGFCYGKPHRSGKFGPNNWLEVYQPPSSKYLTVTGHPLNGIHTVGDGQTGLDWLTEQYPTKKPLRTKTPFPRQEAPLLADDQELLDKAIDANDGGLFRALWSGDTSRHENDHSAADMGLCLKLAFWTAKDATRMDSLFRQSGLYRPWKWDKRHYSTGETYGEHTISEALSKQSDVYKPETTKTNQNNMYKEDMTKKAGMIHQVDWKDLLRYRIKEDGSKGALLKTPYNVALILSHDPHLQGVFGFDEFQNSIVLAKPLPNAEGLTFPKNEAGRPIQDVDLVAVRCWFSQSEYNLNVAESTIAGAISLVSSEHSFHPIRDYLDGLVWDGTSRLDEWLKTYLLATGEDVRAEKYLTLVGPKWMIQAVARVYRPGCKADYVLILEGPQGIQKSSALKVLAGEENFNDTPFGIGNKDAYLQIQGCWIVELAELDALMRAESSAAKAFFTSAFDKYRPPYGRNTVNSPRQCVFAGTVNGNEYIKDRTGARRYWPVWCGSIRISELKHDRDQLWAEAVYRFKNNEKGWPEGYEEHKLCKEAQDLRILDDPWEAQIAQYIEGVKRVTVGDILKHALDKPTERWNKSDEIRVGQLMQRWGWTRKRPWNKERTQRLTVYVAP